MSYNPYAPPQAAQPPALPGSAAQGEPQPWELGEVLRAAWASYKPNWVPLSIGLLITGGIGVAVQEIPAGLVGLGVLQEDTLPARALVLVFMIVSWLIREFFSAGFIRAALGTMRTGTARFADIFAPGPRFGPYLVTTFLSGLLVGLGFVALIVPGIILSLGLWMAPFYAYDRGLGPVEAMRASWDTSVGQKGPFFVLGLAQFGLLLLGLLACCMGGLVTECVVLLARTIIFMRLAGLAQGTLADAYRAPT